jgi:hypothetical protein
MNVGQWGSRKHQQGNALLNALVTVGRHPTEIRREEEIK